MADLLCYEGAFRSVFDGKFGYASPDVCPTVSIANPYIYSYMSPVTFAHTRVISF